MEVTLDGETLSEKGDRGAALAHRLLVLLRGQWVEIDRERLERAIQQFREAEQLANAKGSIVRRGHADARGCAVVGWRERVAVADWSQVTAGPWLADTLRGLRSPDACAGLDPGPALRGTLRPYQQRRRAVAAPAVGAAARRLPCRRHGAGQDHAGAGAAAGVSNGHAATPSLLVAPASLLANWAAEIEKFAPT